MEEAVKMNLSFLQQFSSFQNLNKTHLKSLVLALQSCYGAGKTEIIDEQLEKLRAKKTFTNEN